MSSGGIEKVDFMAALALQMARAEVRLRVETALRAEPQRANWQLSRALAVKRTAIVRIRAALEARGKIPAQPRSLFRLTR